MSAHQLAGKLAPHEMLVNVPRLVSAYYTNQPDPGQPAHRVAFGTSGHRGSSHTYSFNETHILAISQAICEYRKMQGYSGPLYMGMDTHALSEPAMYTALEVFAANAVEVVIQQGLGYTPTPVISLAILTYNRDDLRAWRMVWSSPLHTTRRRMAVSNITRLPPDRRIPLPPGGFRTEPIKSWQTG